MSLLTDPANNDSTIILPHGPVPVKQEQTSDCEIVLAPKPIKVITAGKPKPNVVTPDWKVVAEYRAKDIEKLRKQIDEQSTRIREYITSEEEHERDYKAQAEELESALDETEMWKAKCAEKAAQAKYWRAKFRAYALKKGDKKVADLAGDDPLKYNEDLLGDDDDLVF